MEDFGDIMGAPPFGINTDLLRFMERSVACSLFRIESVVKWESNLDTLEFRLDGTKINGENVTILLCTR